MPLIFAFVVAAQIHTGSDLLAACQQRDTTACDAFIVDAVKHMPRNSCDLNLADMTKLRGDVVSMLQGDSDLKAAAAKRAIFLVNSGCGTD